MKTMSARFACRLLLVSSAVVALAACGQAEEAQQPAVQEASDPMMNAALADQIMVDPDMVNRNGANRAVSFGSGDGSIPLPDSGSDAIIAAREEAIALVGGNGSMLSAPQPERVAGDLPPEAALSVAARAASVGVQLGDAAAQDCAELSDFSAIWAARLPDEFPVYPRGAVQEAAGTDEAGCNLRVINFTTPVSLDDVMDFYFTRASASGFEIQRIRQGEDDVLGGTIVGGARSFMVFARRLADGMTSVDLVTTGA